MNESRRAGSGQVWRSRNLNQRIWRKLRRAMREGLQSPNAVLEIAHDAASVRRQVNRGH
jgi:hypothetical protein